MKQESRKNNMTKVGIILVIIIIAIILGTTKSSAFPGFVYYGTDGYPWGVNTGASNYNEGIPCKEGYELYCIDHGNHVAFERKTSISGLDNSYIEKLYENYIKNGTTYLKVNNDSQAILGTYYMNTYYYKSPDFVDTELNNKLAYILSAYDYSNKGQRQIMQYALWQASPKGATRASWEKAETWAKAGKLLTEAKNYETFILQLEKEKQTRDNKLITYINAGEKEAKEITENTFTVGDFKLSYTNGTYSGTTFGGITDMYLEGYDVNGNLVANRIDITSVIVDNTEKNLKFFTPNTTKSNYGISTQSVYYPKSGTAFKVKFNKPEEVVSVKLVTKYSYMKASGTYTKYDGVLAAINVYRNSNNDKYIKLTNISRTQSVWDVNATRTMETETIVSEEVDVLGFIKLSGYVWEDEKAGKESEINGIKDENEKFINGIKVTLHTADGSNIMYVKEGDNIVKKNVATLSTTTGMNSIDGYYEFIVQKNKAGAEYYVEFTYNGQNYQHTKYVPWSTTSSSNGKTSNATETESTRDNMNSALAEITPTTSVKSTINDQGPEYISESACTISAYTGGYGNANNITYYNDNSEEINLGITKREVADLALRKDIYKASVSIKGYSQEYIYNKREGLETDEQGNSYWDIKARESDVYYGASYTREVKPADYNYTGENRLGATVTYKITVRNQSEGINAKVTEIVDYYDSEYSYLGAYLGDKNGNKIGDIIASTTSKYGSTTNITGYEKMYFTGIENTTIAPSGDMYIYVTLRVNTDANGNIILDENDSGKGNITEIMGYKTYYESNTAPNEGNANTYTEYKAGDIAGRIDVDSNPGNATTADTSTYEDDTDKAPYIKFVLANEDRNSSGLVWEDSRTETVENAVIGNGKQDDGENRVNGVTVELWDIDEKKIAKIWNGTTWVDATIETTDNGEYAFSGFVPGNYYIKFTYKNGQTYKSTTYNPKAIFNVNNPDELGEYVETEEKYSDARDLWSDRQRVNALLPEETNGIRTAYDSTEDNATAIQAITGLIKVYIEKDPNNASSNSRDYKLDNIDFGIEQRPKAQLMLSKEVTNVKVTLANGNTLFDASGKATNVLWQEKQYHNIVNEDNMLKQATAKSEAQKIVLTMDEELMQGATIAIKYNIKIKNVGETDYNETSFYYTGNVENKNTLVKTTLNKIIDYVGTTGATDVDKATANNLKFDKTINDGWETITLQELYDNNLVSRELLNKENNEYVENVARYNTIITKTFNKELVPQEEISTELILSQVMAADNSSDDLTYNNTTEIISLSNDVGKKMEYSVVGNQNPDGKIAEVDADCAQTITVLPPFGQTYIYYILGIGVAAILAIGVITIKKKIIDKR